MNPTTPRPKGSTRIGDIDAIRQPGATHCRGEAASLSWAYGMPLSYVQEMANHWLGLHEETMRPAPGGSENDRNASLDTSNE